MNIRAPWLEERLALLALAAWDILVVFTVYFSAYKLQLGVWPGPTRALFLLWFLWLGGSYLLGRYTQQLDFIKSFQRTILLSFLILSLFIAQAWLAGITGSGTRLRGFLLPLVMGMAICSEFLHQATSILFSNIKVVVLFCTAAEKLILQQELCNVQGKDAEKICLVDENDDQNFIYNLPRRGLAIAISESACISDTLIDKLISFRPLGVRVGSLVDCAERALHRVPPELLSDRWLLAADGFSLQPGRWSWRLKRIFDVFGAIALIIVAFPLCLIAAILIWLEDRGPIFYSQIRSGLYGDPIRIWKLRTMCVDAEVEGIRWAQKSDSRITKCGLFLRRLRLDELPQLWAVLSGDLSLIGPRPERPELEVELERCIPHYRVRHWIRPGLSGWAQVNFPYGNSLSDSRIKLSYDLYYLRNAGILLDFLILIKTIRLVLRAQGAQPQQ